MDVYEVAITYYLQVPCACIPNFSANEKPRPDRPLRQFLYDASPDTSCFTEDQVPDNETAQSFRWKITLAE